MKQEVDPKDAQSAPSSHHTEVERETAGEVAPQEKQGREEWREEFPYPWDEDAKEGTIFSVNSISHRRDRNTWS